MLKGFLIFSVIFFGVINANANNLKVVGKAQFSFLFWSIYNAELRSKSGKYNRDGNFTLELEYLRNFSGEDIARRTITEIKNQGFKDKQKLSEWKGYLTLYIHAPDFYVTNYGITLTSIGAILVILRIIDSIQDPLIGYLCDRFSEHRRAILKLGALFLGVGFFGLFNPIEEFIIAWFFLNILLATTGFSIIAINLNTIGGVWSENYNERTKISVFREGLGLVGLIFAAALPSVLSHNGNSPETFFVYSVIMVFILSASSLIFFTLFFKKFQPKITKNKLDFNKLFINILNNKSFYGTYFLSVLASSIPAILFIFFVRDRLDMEEYIGLFLISYFLSGAASMPFWHYISKKTSKVTTWKYSMIIAILSFFWAFFLEAGNLYQYLAICIFSGIAFGAELSIPPAILADKVQKETATTEYSSLTFLMKLSLAFSAGLIFPLLEANNFKAGKDNTESSLVMLSFFYAILPCILKLFALISLTKFLKIGENNNVKNSKNVRGGYATM